jgi:hypothetical protein
MRISLIFAAVVASFGLVACSGSPTSAGAPALAGSFGAAPAGHVRPDVTSTTVKIQNSYSSSINLETLNSQCLTGSAPTTVGANSTSPAFTVSYPPACTEPTAYFDMTYGPSGGASGVDYCTFNINFTETAGPFSYSVTNGSKTTCSFTLSDPTVNVKFIYNHS